MSFQFFTIDQVSQLTGMSSKWLWAQCRANAVAHHRFGRVYRFSEQDLSDLTDQTAVTPALARAPEPTALTAPSPRQGFTTNRVP